MILTGSEPHFLESNEGCEVGDNFLAHSVLTMVRQMWASDVQGEEHLREGILWSKIWVHIIAGE